MDLVTHSSVLIERSAAAIWPYIVDVTAWKKGPEARHIDGARGQVGEVFVAIMHDAPSKPLFNMETVGFINVIYDFYAEIPLSTEDVSGATAQSLALKQTQYIADNETRSQGKLQDFRKLVEIGPARHP
jgi:hypothetical protein